MSFKLLERALLDNVYVKQLSKNVQIHRYKVLKT